MRTLLFSLTLGVLLGAAAPSVASESFRCGSHIIEEGMSLDKVRELCGNPTEETGDRWTYDRGDEQLLVVLHVHADNTVGMIETRPHE